MYLPDTLISSGLTIQAVKAIKIFALAPKVFFFFRKKNFFKIELYTNKEALQ